MNAVRGVLDWSELDVQNWLASKGYPQYEDQIKYHKISGDILCVLDANGFKSLGVSSLGQRLAILKAVYQLKVANGVEIRPGDYVPPSEVSEPVQSVSLSQLHTTVTEQGARLHHLEEDNRSLHETLRTLRDELSQFRSQSARPQEESTSNIGSSGIKRQPSFKWAQYVKPTKSPTKQEMDSPHPSPQQLEHDHSRISQASTSTTQTLVQEASTVTPIPSRPSKSDNADFRNFKVSMEDPTWKVLPAALKKYRINNDTWQNYAMFICYGSSGNRQERCLTLDEKPLLLFQKLKETNKNPVFMLKHIKDIHSPIAVARQKHAARKASSVITTATVGHARAPSRPHNRPPKLEVSDLSAPAPVLTGIIPPQGWPDSGVLSPSIDQRDELGAPNAAPNPHTTIPVTATINDLPSRDRERDPPPNEHGDIAAYHTKEVPVGSNGISYGVAIYPYMAEHEDEFDVVVGDIFIVLSRRKGWWIVQRDPNGTGIIETDISKQGWVPAGCLLETNVPIAAAIADATAAKSNSNGNPPLSASTKTPILPLSIISTSVAGAALMDYKKKGDEELDLAKDDLLRVFKKYNYWSYAVKEDGGDRGWVPSWFIGKVPTSNDKNVPPTPSANMPLTVNQSLDDSIQAQVSPMSSAFPSKFP